LLIAALPFGITPLSFHSKAHAFRMTLNLPLLTALVLGVTAFDSFAADRVPLLEQAGATQSGGWLTGPSTFRLEAIGATDTGVGGITLVTPLVRRGEGLLLVEGFGYKGDANFGYLGGGLIARHRFAPGEVLELSGMVEGLQDRDDFSYAQAGIGVAYTRGPFTARANGYIPFSSGDERRKRSGRWTQELHHPSGTVDWSRDTITRRSPAAGFDAEIEWGLPAGRLPISPHIAVGYFYRAGSEQEVEYSGVLVRGEIHFGQHWSLEAEWRSDADDFGQELRFAVTYQTFFGSGGEASSPDQQLLYGPVERRPWPAVASRERTKTWSKDPEIRHEAADDCCGSDTSPLIFD
jgi:hypothetical protein